MSSGLSLTVSAAALCAPAKRQRRGYDFLVYLKISVIPGVLIFSISPSTAKLALHCVA